MRLSNRVVWFITISCLFLVVTLEIPNVKVKVVFGCITILWIVIMGIYAIYRPLKKTEDYIQQIKVAYKIVVHPNDKRNPLLIQLLDCIDMVEAQVKETYSATMLDKQAQIGALQSQINPHFLYNTLESIRGEALSQDCDGIASMVKALASFFRYSISRKENIVTLQDELNNIKNYFLIQAYRFDNKFDLNIILEDQDEELLGCYMPKLTIQPIVENAIFHGLETKAGKGCVTIRINSTEERFVIMISDDGIGIEEEILRKLKLKLDQGEIETDNSKKAGTGIALSNVNQRIKIIFGQEYGMQIYSTKGLGTDIEMIMPIVKDIHQL